MGPLSATIANRLQAQHLPEVAGERRVEAEHSDKLAESLPVRDRIDLELRRPQTLQGDRARQSVASDRSRCPAGKISLSPLGLRWFLRVSSQSLTIFSK